MGFYVVILFPFNGMFVVFLWALSMCNLIQGYIATKNGNYLIGLAGLSFVNAFYIPTVLHYKLFEYISVNYLFWIGNLIAAIFISVLVKKKCRIGRFKSLILFVICLVPAYIITTRNRPDWSIGALYITMAVVVFPICYYAYARKIYNNREMPNPEDNSYSARAENEDTFNGE